jgi:hypothetical protein
MVPPCCGMEIISLRELRSRRLTQLLRGIAVLLLGLLECLL